MLWLSLYLPHLPLEVFLRGGEPTAPLAVTVTRNNRAQVLARSRAAAQAGIRPGTSVGGALALCDDLLLKPRNESAEAAALEGIAVWAGQFTSLLTLHPPDSVLLEIQGSLRLFGGIEALRRRIAEGLETLGYRARLAVAPTPLGSRLLAKAHFDASVTDCRELAELLNTFPLRLLELPPETLLALEGMGLRTIADCLRQPRAGLAKRLGLEFIGYLDRLLGKTADPRPPFTAPPCFRSQLLLPAEAENSNALLFAARRLFLELGGFLLARGVGVQAFELTLLHHHKSPSCLPVGLVAPSRQSEHLMGLLKERLEQFKLPAPVEGLILSAEKLVPLHSHEEELFTAAKEEQPGWPQLVERLRSRLGNEAVMGLQPLADHRPERAWCAVMPGHVKVVSAAASRPLWLLSRPEPLRTVRETPWHGGPLALKQGPERIESGWWDGDEVVRDYFVAENPRHECYWIYREGLGERRWFLHGVFG